jgi:manganese/zinc/iron transport system substrate-binding protein
MRCRSELARGCVAYVVLTCLGLAGCSSASGPPEFREPPVRVVCTTTIIADAVHRVGGQRVHVSTLMGPGVDPHKYLAKLDDRKKLDEAHLIFFNGLHLEGKMADLFEKNDRRWRAYPVTGGIPVEQLRRVEGNGGEYDPHVWFDVRLWKSAVLLIRDRLSELDPAGSTTYEANTTQYLAELDRLDAEIRSNLTRVPPHKRVLVTSHDAFGYFGRAYGFEVIGLQGVSTASETGTARRAELARTLGERRLSAVFTESSVPDDGLRAVLDDVRTRHRHEVRLIGGDRALFSDSLGEPGSSGESYVGMIRHNVAVIVAALGDPPP